MPNPRLTSEQLKTLFQPFFEKIKAELAELSGGEPKVLWALRRKIAKELVYLERGKPAERRKLQNLKYSLQNGRCAMCNEKLPERGGELDRFEAYLGYTEKNTRLVCHECHIADQKAKNFT